MDEICEEDIMPFNCTVTKRGKVSVDAIQKNNREKLKALYIAKIEELMKNGKSGPEIAPFFLGLVICYSDLLYT